MIHNDVVNPAALTNHVMWPRSFPPSPRVEKWEAELQLKSEFLEPIALKYGWTVNDLPISIFSFSVGELPKTDKSSVVFHGSHPDSMAGMMSRELGLVPVTCMRKCEIAIPSW